MTTAGAENSVATRVKSAPQQHTGQRLGALPVESVRDMSPSNSSMRRCYSRASAPHAAVIFSRCVAEKISEKSAILVENGVYKGFAFYDLNYQINNPEVLRNIITPMQNNRDVKNILQSHIRKSKFLKIINF